jgi:hypothetical protein
MEKISWTDRVESERVLRKFGGGRNTLHTIKRKRVKWIGYTLRRNCLLKHVTEGKIQGTGRRGRRRKQLLKCLKERRKYWILR